MHDELLYPPAAVPAVLFRVSRSPSFDSLPPWSVLEQDGTERGRLDDDLNVYRVLYAADSLRTAFIEVLAHFRTAGLYKTLASEVTGESDPTGLTPDDVRKAMTTYLRNRFAHEITIPDTNALVADVALPSARRQLEIDIEDVLAARNLLRLKVGDLISADTTIPRAASRAVYNANGGRFAGLLLPSAEDPRGRTIGVFEDGHDSNTFRTSVVGKPGAASSHMDLIEEAVEASIRFSQKLQPRRTPRRGPTI